MEELKDIRIGQYVIVNIDNKQYKGIVKNSSYCDHDCCTYYSVKTDEKIINFNSWETYNNSVKVYSDEEAENKRYISKRLADINKDKNKQSVNNSEEYIFKLFKSR